MAEPLLAAGRIPGLPKPARLRREVVHGRSRFDFLLEREDGRGMFVEVKAVSLVEGGVALFPDAPTVRGARHLRELADLARAGEGAAVLFILQRDDAREVRPHAKTDPDFAEALATARSQGVIVRAAAFRLKADGSADYSGSRPVRIPGPARTSSPRGG